uniref:Venom S1 protease 12 n=1 Tax=Platymeris rhadamanthus TaxID=1134088 RepID=A0A6B9L1J4_PLARH|nr:venom S1 protease 12 [Platymeris rhadamanthus]
MRLVYCITIAVLLGIAWAYPQSYLKVKSKEIDSSEHGQKAGQKTTNCSCGWTNKARIVGGRETLKNEFPLMAGIMDMDKKHLFCGATILTPNHAISASHCTQPYKGKKLGLVVGAHDVSKPDEKADIIPIKETIEHEGYNPKSYFNDVALLVLTRSITFTQHIGPACLPAGRTNLLNESIKVLGWGRLVHKGKTSPVLMKVNLRIIPTKVCAKKYLRKIPTDNPFQLCTFGRKKDSCQGDSGGPLIWLDPQINRYTLVGMVSYGKTCGAKTPAVNSDLSFFLPWVQAKIAASGLPGQTCAKID